MSLLNAGIKPRSKRTSECTYFFFTKKKTLIAKASFKDHFLNIFFLPTLCKITKAIGHNHVGGRNF